MNDFSSIEKLVAFGLELSIAQQMIASMNQTMRSIDIPGSMTDDNRCWFIAVDGNPTGPYMEKDLLAKLLSNELTIDSLVWRVGLSDWKFVKDTPEILKLITLLPPSL